MPSNFRTVCNLVISVVGALIGISACICFSILGNTTAAVYAFLSGVLASVVLHLHVLEVKGILRNWHSWETLNSMKLLGVMGSLFGAATFIWHIFNALYYNIPMVPVQNSHYIMSVWSFMTAKWGLFIYYHCHMYGKNVQTTSHAGT